MVREVTPREVGREIGWELYHDSPMPFASVVATIDAGRLMDFYHRRRDSYKLNALILYLLLKACEPVKETKLNLIGGKLYQYDRSCITCTMHDDEGSLRIACIPYEEDLDSFQREYNRVTQQCRTECRDIFCPDMMQIGTSNFGAYNVQVEAAIPAYCPRFNNPFFTFGRIMEQDGRQVLIIALSDNHMLMDGEHVCAVLENFQNLITGLE